MSTKKKSAKAESVDVLDGDAEQLRFKLKKIHAQEREVAKLEKVWNDARIKLTAAHKEHDKAVLKMRELISGVPQSEMPFAHESDEDEK